MYSVYILRSKKDGTLYVGYSSNIKNRIQEHEEGKVPATPHKRPMEAIYPPSQKTTGSARG